MTGSLRVLYMPADGHPEVRHITPDLEHMQALVGGWLEAISGSTHLINEPGPGPYWHWTAYLDEEGKIKRLPVNRAATLFARAIGWQGDTLVGPVVFMGPPNRDGEETDAPDWMLNLFPGQGRRP